MRELVVDLGARSYPIRIGPGLLSRVGAHLKARGVGTDRSLFVVTDEHVGPLYLERVRRALEGAGYRVAHVTVPAGERAKSLAVYARVIEAMIRAELDRKSVVLALGGGAVGDLAGFAAATFMRGVDYVQLPTTILAHDSSVGGKTGINHPLGKNLIGAFHQPLLVLYDTDTLKTLPPREVRSGLAEVVKHAAIGERAFFDWLLVQADAVAAGDADALGEALYRGCRVKAQVVARDERETSLRAILNFGHTVGHALEALDGYAGLTHGEAVAVGMVAAAALSERLGVAVEPVAEPIRALLERFGLPTQVPARFDPARVLEAMRRDKKRQDGKLVMVLLAAIGQPVVVRDVPEAAVRAVLEDCRQQGD